MKNLSQFLNFLAVARHGSFAQAARELGLAPSSVAKSVARLEHHIDARLFQRTTRSMTLTEEGRLLAEKGARVLKAIEALELGSAKAETEPAGVLHIGAPVGYGVRVLLPILTRLQQRYRLLDIDLRLSDARVGLHSEGLDAVIRFGELDDSTLIARKIDEQALVLCASPQYLASRPKISTVHDLANHALIAFRLQTSGRDRHFEFMESGQKIVLTPAARFRISHGEALAEAAALGAGLAQMPEFLAGPYLTSGTLVEVLPDCRPAPLAVNLVLPGSKIRPARVRGLIDVLTGQTCD